MATENTGNTEEDEWRGAADAAARIPRASAADRSFLPLCVLCVLWGNPCISA